jgi:RNA polymerase sigma factor (sigma-70 family)
MPSTWPEPSQTPTRLRRKLERRRRAETRHPAPPAIVPVVTAADDLSATLERRLLPTVQRAHAGCQEARDALYIAFGPKLERFTRRVHAPFLGDDRTGVWDRDDVEQEAWLVFDELIAQWTPERPFGRYILATFPWRLRDAVYRGIGRRGVPSRMALVAIGEHDWLRDGSAAADEAQVLLEIIAERLPAMQAMILRRHVGDGETLSAIARDLDISRRTITRQWRAVRDQLAGDDDTPPNRHLA